MRTVYDLLCGCGRRNRVTSLLAQAKCEKCRWVLVYATGNAGKEMALTCPVLIRRLAADKRKRKAS